MKGFLPLRRPLYQYQVDHPLSEPSNERAFLPLTRPEPAVCPLTERDRYLEHHYR